MGTNPLDNPKTRAAHLLRRAGFGGTPAEIEAFAAMDYRDAVEKLLTFKYDGNLAFDLERRLQDNNYTAALPDLGYWWMLTMLRTKQPLQEKMTLFWHGHFTTGFNKVNKPIPLLTQNQLFRDNAIGNFGTLVKKVSRDPAMIDYLDGQSNHKGKPNENYARELQELFTIGIGNYTEQDVREAARAFTGWGFKGRAFFFDKNQHDTGQKTFMGQSGNFDGDDIIDIILSKKQTATNMVTKFWNYFGYLNPEPELVGRLADGFFNSKYDVKELVRTILLSPEFLSEKAYRGLVKNPVEYALGMIRQLGSLGLDDNLPRTAAAMGQILFAPPTVKGWDGGLAWINSTHFFERINAADQLTTARGNKYKYDLGDVLTSNKLDNLDKFADYNLNLLLDGQYNPALKTILLDYANSDGTLSFANLKAGGNKAQTTDSKLRGVVHLIMSTPEYMLK